DTVFVGLGVRLTLVTDFEQPASPTAAAAAAPARNERRVRTGSSLTGLFGGGVPAVYGLGRRSRGGGRNPSGRAPPDPPASPSRASTHNRLRGPIPPLPRAAASPRRARGGSGGRTGPPVRTPSRI